MLSRFSTITTATALLVAGALVLPPEEAASAGTDWQARVVSADPLNRTPHVLDGIVNALAVVDGKVVVGGSFNWVRNAGETTELPRSNIFAFDPVTGKVDPHFAPEIDDAVFTLAEGTGGTVYAGGVFSAVNGWRQRLLARLSLRDGSAVYGFSPGVRGDEVSSLVRQGDHLYVGGDFEEIGDTQRTALARLNSRTGAVDPAFAITPGRGRGGRTRVYAMAATRDRLLVDGSFMTLDGLTRPQVGLIDIGAPRAKVAKWRTDAYAAECKDVFPSYVRGLDFSPDGKYFVVVTTGGPKHPLTLCDSAARFETYSRGRNIKPTWVNRTGGDSLYAVSATGAAVYVGGHQRWLDNPKGADSRGPGAVSRPGIGAINPVTGKALPWNPTRARGIGVKAFLPYRGGLLVGSDTTWLGHEYHARVGMFPAGH